MRLAVRRRVEYKNIIKGEFVSRPNRFIAKVLVDNQIVECHVKNTGRCKELLIEGASLYLQDHKNNMRQRKLRYSVICVEKKVDWLRPPDSSLDMESQTLLINMDSLAPNTIVKEAILDGTIKVPGFDKEKLTLFMERTYGNSRFDVFLEQGEKKAFIEVKGVTLEDAGISRFPDAPTIRGLKHVEELIAAKSEGYDAFIIFVVQMGEVGEFRPNDTMHKEFGDALRRAAIKGVVPMAFNCIVEKNSLRIYRRVNVQLHNI